MKKGHLNPKVYGNMTQDAIDEAHDEEYDENKMCTAVSLRYQGNSKLLAGFYDAIENKVIN
jgi:putative IMPACT (imprinted ancient) family translation regulator